MAEHIYLFLAQTLIFWTMSYLKTQVCQSFNQSDLSHRNVPIKLAYDWSAEQYRISQQPGLKVAAAHMD